MMTDITRVNLVVTRQRVDDEVDVDDLIDASNGSLEATRKLLAIFVTDDAGNYVPLEDGLRIIGKMKVGQLKAKVRELFGNIDNAVVPKESGTP